MYFLVENVAFLARQNDQRQEATMKNFKGYDTNLLITRHARSRMQQRCFKKSDINAIFCFGTAITGQEILFTNKDAEREINILR
jgi:hypothetical protein